MRVALIKDNIVVNIAEFDAFFIAQQTAATLGLTAVDVDNISARIGDIYKNGGFYPDGGFPISDIRQNKFIEIGEVCTNTIYAGIDVKTSIGIKHFSLEQHDQTELMGLKPNLDVLVASGDFSTPTIPYHADGELCRLWNAMDFGAILKAATNHIFYHRTYCNHLNEWIRRENNKDVLSTIFYGSDLPKDLAENMSNILAASGG